MNKKVLNIFLAILIMSFSFISVYAGYIQGYFYDNSGNNVKYVCYDSPGTGGYYSCAVLIPSQNTNTNGTNCTLSDGSTLNNGSSKNLYYKNSSGNSCNYASYKCNNGSLARGTQFSPAPSQPAAGSTLYTSSSACTASLSYGETGNSGCSGTLPTGAGVVSCDSRCVDFSPQNFTWTYNSSPTTSCTWGCASGYTKSGNSCVANSSTPPTTVSGTCSGLPSNAVYYNGATSYSISNAPNGTSLNATYQSTPTSNTCKYKCNSTSSRNGSSCVLNNSGGNTGTTGWKWQKISSAGTYFSPMPPSCTNQVEGGGCNEGGYCIGNGYDLKCQYSGAQSGLIKIETNYGKLNISNCSDPGATLNFTIWNSPSDIKACIEYNLTAQGRNGETYNCDSDSKFSNLSSSWKYEGSSTSGKWSYFTYLQNNNTFVPGKYRLIVKASDGVKVYGDWLTINTGGSFSNPANCKYYAYQAQSVEDALWYLHKNGNVHISTGIDWKNIPVPSGCDITKDVLNRLISDATMGASFSSQRVLSFTDLHKCFTRKPPTWTGPTYIGGFGSKVNGQINNDAGFDFQSWYNGGDSWTLVGAGCGNVPTHGLSQYYGGIKWENGKTFNCSSKTYGGVSIGGGTTTTGTNCTLSDGSTLNNGSSKNLYYKNSSGNSCNYASYKCNNGSLARGTQFSPAPSQPAAGSTLYTSSSACTASLSSGGTGNSGCSGTLPTGVGVVSCDSRCVDFSPQNFTWTYNSSPTTSCTWGCASGYTKSGNSCVANSTSTAPNLPACGTNWKTIGTFTCDSQNRQVQTITTCLPNGYSDPALWNWNKTTNTFSHITGNLCNGVPTNGYPGTQGTTNSNTSNCSYANGTITNGETKTLYFSNSPYTSCIDAIFSCSNGQLKWSTQFSPAPPQPSNWSKLYSTSDSCKSGYGISNNTSSTIPTCSNPDSYYLYYNGDVAKDAYYGAHPKDHWDQFGYKEGRKTCRPVPTVSTTNPVNTTISGKCNGLPSNAIYSNNSTSYSLTNAPTGTSLNANYSANPSSNTCMYKCNTGYSWNGNSCVSTVNSNTVSGKCSGLPSNSVYYNDSTSYSLSNAPTGTSLNASYNSNPSKNTCQYRCRTMYTRVNNSCTYYLNLDY